MLAYTKTCDNTIIQKFPLPRVLLHGQTDTTEDEDRGFFKEVVDKSVRDAISSHNEAYYNILDLSTQGSNQVCTSHQEAAPASNGDVQVVQGSSKQAQGTTANQIEYNPGPSIQHVQ